METDMREKVRESIKRAGRRWDLQRKRVKPSKEERGRCGKENIGNSISGGATSRTSEYISSSHREGGRWREHGGGKAVERLWGLLCDSFVTFPFAAVTTVSLPFFEVCPYDLFSVSLRHRSTKSRICQIFFVMHSGFLCSIFFLLSFSFNFLCIIWLNIRLQLNFVKYFIKISTFTFHFALSRICQTILKTLYL